VKFTPPIIKKDEEVKKEDVPPPQEKITASGPKEVKGDTNAVDPGVVVPDKPTGPVAAPPPPKIFTYVEQMPGPSYDLNEFVDKHLNYPEQARESNIQGRVIIKFVVNEDGRISDVTLVKGIGGGCDEEAMKVVRSLPNWKPGKQNGNAVKVWFTYPISFKLQ
jgi:periplasmic protein TonB